MSFTKVILMSAVLLLPPLANGDDEALNDILKNSKQVVNESDALAGDTVDELKGVAPSDLVDADWLNGTRSEFDEPTEGRTAQQRGWNEIMDNVAGGTVVVDDGPPRPKVPDDVMYVYISLSMPKETIRSLFLQALNDEERSLRTIIFLLRGWDAPGPNTLVTRLNALFPDAEKLRELPNVQINPVLFQQQGIELVPTFTTKNADGLWGTVVGSTSIVDAVRRIEEGLYDGEVIGPKFAIEEPDILKLIQERMAGVNWEEHVERVRSKVLTTPTVGRALPYATEDATYLVDLTIVNNRDLRGTSGEVFAPAGVSVNPFDYVTTHRKYIFIDANSAEQVKQALKWKQQYDYTTMISTVPATTTEQRTAVIRELGQPLHEINEMLIARFKLVEVPSIAYQEGKMLRVDVVATAPQRALIANGDGNE